MGTSHVRTLLQRCRRRAVSMATVGIVLLQFGLGARAVAAGGDLDQSFGTGGKVVVQGLGGGDGVALQTDGKIVVATEQGNHFAVARFHPDGTLDRAFGGDGIVSKRFGGGPPKCYAQALDMEVQTDGRIVAIGNSCGGALTVARFNHNGTLDPSFGDGGKVFINKLGHCTHLSGPTGALGLHGKIVAGTSGLCAGRDRFVVVRLKHDGTLDGGFSGDGMATAFVQKGVFEGEVAGVAVQPDGRILIAGSALYKTYPEGEGDSDVAVVRFDRGGSLDRTFGGGDGKVTTKFPGPRCGGVGEAQGLALEPDGKIVVGGTAGCTAGPGTLSHPRWALLRYRPSGTLDPTFGTGGVVVSVFQKEEGGDSMYGGIALQANGKIVGAGNLNSPSGGWFALARYRANGRIDATFGDGGMVLVKGWGLALAAVVQADGKIVATGADPGLAMARFLAS
jgi:uncharacterized delta-60 repeat protein